MEATTKERVGLLDKILPPELEDAGLEDCALSPESIQEAFRKASDAVNSRAASLFEYEEEGGCLTDPHPALKRTTEKAPSLGASDTIIVGGGNEKDTGPFLAGKGNGKLAELEKAGDLVVAGEGGEGKSCGDDLKDLDDEGLDFGERQGGEGSE